MVLYSVTSIITLLQRIPPNQGALQTTDQNQPHAIMLEIGQQNEASFELSYF